MADTWITQQGEEVGKGDRVALNLLGDTEAIVRLEAEPAGTGGILCVFVASKFPSAIGKYYLATEDQLLMKMPEGTSCCTGAAKGR